MASPAVDAVTVNSRLVFASRVANHQEHFPLRTSSWYIDEGVSQTLRIIALYLPVRIKGRGRWSPYTLISGAPTIFLAVASSLSILLEPKFAAGGAGDHLNLDATDGWRHRAR